MIQGGDVKLTDDISAERIIGIIETSRINLSTETAAQRGLSDLFVKSEIKAEAETRLTPKDRIDFMIGSIGIEVKIGSSRRSILRQLERYAACDQVQSLILVTAIAFPSMGFEINGKPVRIANLSMGWL